MKNFLKMIEVAKSRGIIAVENGKASRFQNIASFWRLVEKNNPFVFSPIPGGMLDPTPDGIKLRTGYAKEESFDPPFEVFSIEVLGDSVCKALAQTENCSSECILVAEVRPKEFCYFVLITNSITGQQEIIASNAEGVLVESYLNRLDKEESGFESVRQSVRVGTGSDKRVHRIRRIIHVSPKRGVSAHQAATGRVIDWSHRWTVRGHWVALPGGLGKDREGNYCVANFTWRKEHVKGPEAAPLITKTRLVKERVS